MFKKFLKDINGATAIEYGLIAGMVSLATIGGITAIGTNTTVTMINISGRL
jgi:pilus assembly protein Flp/PilA